MIVLVNNTLRTYDDPTLLYFDYVLYITRQIESFEILSISGKSIQEYLTSLKYTDGDYILGKVGPESFRDVVWKLHKQGDESRLMISPSFKDNAERIEYCLKEKIRCKDNNPNNPDDIICMVNNIERTKFYELWAILKQCLIHFKLPHEYGIEPFKKLIKVLKSGLKHLPNLNKGEEVGRTEWIFHYFLLNDGQECDLREVLHKFKKENKGLPISNMIQLIYDFQFDLVKTKCSKFLRNCIPISDFARYCILVRHSIFSNYKDSKYNLVLFWNQIWKEWSESTDEERLKKMIAYGNVYRSWADDDEMKLFIESSGGSDDETDSWSLYDPNGLSTTPSHDGSSVLELISEEGEEEELGGEADNEDTFVGVDGNISYSDNTTGDVSVLKDLDAFNEAITSKDPSIGEFLNLDSQPNIDCDVSVPLVKDESIQTIQLASTDLMAGSHQNTASRYPVNIATRDENSKYDGCSDEELLVNAPVSSESDDPNEAVGIDSIENSNSDANEVVENITVENTVGDVNATLTDIGMEALTKSISLEPAFHLSNPANTEIINEENHDNLDVSDSQLDIAGFDEVVMEAPVFLERGDLDSPISMTDSYIEKEFKQPGALSAVLDDFSSDSSRSSSILNSDYERGMDLVPTRSYELPEKIEMFEKLSGHIPKPRNTLHHSMSVDDVNLLSKGEEKEDDVKINLKPVAKRADTGTVLELKNFIENKPELVSLKTVPGFENNETKKASTRASVRKGRSISEIYAALLDDNMKDLCTSAEYRNKIVRPEDLYNRIKIKTDKSWDLLSRRTKERYYGAFLRKYDDELNKIDFSKSKMDIIDIFEIVKVCVDFDDIKHNIVKYAINLVESLDSNNAGESIGSDFGGVSNGIDLKSHKLKRGGSSNASFNSIRSIKLERSSTSTQTLNSLPYSLKDEENAGK